MTVAIRANVQPKEQAMQQNRNAYPELLYAIAADRVREMRAEQAVQEARHARRQLWVRRVRATLRCLSARK
jgi:hypothetical protein